MCISEELPPLRVGLILLKTCNYIILHVRRVDLVAFPNTKRLKDGQRHLLDVTRVHFMQALKCRGFTVYSYSKHLKSLGHKVSCSTLYLFRDGRYYPRIPVLLLFYSGLGLVYPDDVLTCKSMSETFAGKEHLKIDTET